MTSRVFLAKACRVLRRKADSLAGRLVPLGPTLQSMALRPFELHLELTNLCNANCVFCPYQFQERETGFMSDEVFHKAVADFVASGLHPTRVAIHHVVPPGSITPPRLSSSSFRTGSCTEVAPASNAFWYVLSTSGT